MSLRFYLDVIGPATEILGTEAFGLVDRFGEMADDPLVIVSDSWITKIAGHFFRMEQAADVLVNTDAPVVPALPIIQEIETAFKCAGQETHRAIEDLVYGLDNILPVYLEKGIDHMDRTTACINQANELLIEYAKMAGE